MADPLRILLVVAPYYRDIAARLVAGAQGYLESEGAETGLVEVPGALEIPPAIRMAHDMYPGKFDGYVALGCVIRGETSHYEIVVGESARGLMELGIGSGIPVDHWVMLMESALELKELQLFPVEYKKIKTWIETRATRAQHGIPIGNGILTVDNLAQAWARTTKRRNKGEEAARACLSLVRLRDRL